MKKINYSNDFESDKKVMWNIKKVGKAVNLPINLIHLEKLNIGRWKTKQIKKQLPSDNVTYSILDNHIFVHESHGLEDWKQNFMAFSVKVKILDEYVKVHAGFYITAMAIFYDLKKKGLLNDDLIFYAYSHGAGACPLLALRIYDAGFNMPEVLGNFEPPRCIYRPSKRIKKICRNFINYIQGNDFVTKVPMWMKHLGEIRKVKGLKLPWYKKPFSTFFNHEIRPNKL